MIDVTYPIGVCQVSWWDDPLTLTRKLRIDRADRVIQITDELLDEIQARGWAGEGVFMIKAENATARYRLLTHNAENHVWTAERIGPDPLEVNRA